MCSNSHLTCTDFSQIVEAAAGVINARGEGSLTQVILSANLFVHSGAYFKLPSYQTGAQDVRCNEHETRRDGISARTDQANHSSGNGNEEAQQMSSAVQSYGGHTRLRLSGVLKALTMRHISGEDAAHLLSRRMDMIGAQGNTQDENAVQDQQYE